MNAVPLDWATYKHAARVTIAGEEVPAAGIQWTYELNAIPRATISIASGSDASTGEAAPIAALLGSLIGDVPVTIDVARRTAGSARDFGFPEDEWVRVFEGRYVGAGMRRSRRNGAASLDVVAEHWLGELDSSSIFSRWSHPSNPAAYSAALMVQASPTGAVQAPYSGVYDPEGALARPNVAADLWGKTLLPYFASLAKSDLFAVPEQYESAAGRGPAGAVRVPNDAAAAALPRIVARPPLAIAPAAGGFVTDRIAEDLASTLADAGQLAAHTIWDVLVGTLAPTYLFAVVPRFADALVVPYVPVATDWYAGLWTDDYDEVDFTAQGQRPLRAVGALTYQDSSTGMSGSPDAEAIQPLVGGWYRLPNATTGMVHVEQAPRWASRCAAITNYAPEAAGIDGGDVATADRPDAGGPPRIDVRREVVANAITANHFLTRYAAFRAGQLVGAGRRSVVSGPLRADLCPGTSVLLPLAGGAADAGAVGAFLASVVRVSSILDARSGTARTNLDLAHVRSRAEIAAGIGVAEHPLYGAPFLGAAMRD